MERLVEGSLAQVDDFNMYGYTASDPLNRVDHSGESFTLGFAAAGAAIGALSNLGYQFGRGCGFDEDQFFNAVLIGAAAGGSLGLILDTVGRYISADPIGQYGSLVAAEEPRGSRVGPFNIGNANLYSYAASEPVNLTDWSCPDFVDMSLSYAAADL
jgi:hypothetical protein